MSWKGILKADNVGFYGKDKSVAWYDPNTKETTINLTRIVGLEDAMDADLHETIHQFTYDEIKQTLKEVVDEETKFLINRPDLYRVENGKVQPKRQLFNEVWQTKDKIASHIAFTEIVTLIQSRTKVNYESVARDETGVSNYAELDQHYSDRQAVYSYRKQFAEEMKDAYSTMYKNLVKGALNALGLDPNMDTNQMAATYRESLTERGKIRVRKLRDDFFNDMGGKAAYILMEVLEKNEPLFVPTIDYVKQPESYADAKERIKRFKEESPEDRAKRIKDKVAGRKIKKSWKGVLKNIQISGQRTSSKDYVLPEKDDEKCCELLAEFIAEATEYKEGNRFGDGMVGEPTFLSTSGYVPDDDFLEMIYDWKDDITGKRDFYNDVMAQLNKKGDPVKEFKRLSKLWEEASKYGLSHEDSCESLVNKLDKWSDRNFVGWQFYEEWVHPYTSTLSTSAKILVDKEYERYMDSYRKVWMALLQNNCADILIPNDFMNYGKPTLMKK